MITILKSLMFHLSAVGTGFSLCSPRAIRMEHRLKPVATKEERRPEIPAAPKANLHVFVLIDALGWEIIKDRRFLNNELPVRMPLKTVLGYSSGAIPTLLTGRTPAEAGHWNIVLLRPRGLSV